MKVAIDLTPIRTTGEMGGAFQLVVELIKGLAQTRKDEQYLLLTADWNHDFFEQYEKYGLQRVCVTTKPIAASKKRLIKRVIRKVFKLLNININIGSFRRRRLPLLKSKGVDVLFCPMSAINYKEPGIPTVSLIYDMQHEYYPQFFAGEELEHRRTFYRGIKEMADYVTCISQFTRNTFIEKLNFPSDKAEVIYISIQDRLQPDHSTSAEIVNRLELKGKRFAYYPANYWNHKNHHMLLVAFSMFLRQYPELDLYLVLTGSLLDEKDKFYDDLRRMGVNEKVHHFGYVKENEVAVLMSEAEFLIFPSLFEGFGIPVAEAMSAGTPVLCSRNTSLPEVGGEAALYFDARRPDEMVEAMYLVLTDNHMREKLIQRGHEQVKQFSNENMVNQYRNLLTVAANNKSSKGTYISGVHQDNWAGKDVLISFGDIQDKSILYAEIVVPAFVPYRNGKLKVIVNGKRKSYKVIAGESLVIKEELSIGASEISFVFYSSFCPKDLGMPDERELAVQIMKIHLLNKQTQEVIKALHG
ncbi:glycosyltransferase family 4 protein [Cohnella abietis]|uniref:Glycosyl transferase family 1 domain-containing protein n=1 Tax=Cohnella abietis TaxID=2507935 RepID=A0A3T1DDK3_9BACL|nr:glycosyltransferase family 1 protein [Cohnella abietis]BBI36177.1 hypothetical protein KCTCHS21_55760 [Cohnella abietis]